MSSKSISCFVCRNQTRWSAIGSLDVSPTNLFHSITSFNRNEQTWWAIYFAFRLSVYFKNVLDSPNWANISRIQTKFWTSIKFNESCLFSQLILGFFLFLNYKNEIDVFLRLKFTCHISIWERVFLGLFLKGRISIMKFSVLKENGIETFTISYFPFTFEELRAKIDVLFENSC